MGRATWPTGRIAPPTGHAPDARGRSYQQRCPDASSTATAISSTREPASDGARSSQIIRANSSIEVLASGSRSTSSAGNR
jgi:hypothetical protein